MAFCRQQPDKGRADLAVTGDKNIHTDLRKK
jgi:hypothetical protein